MNRFIVFLADGFEDVEGLTVVDYLRRADVDVHTVSVMDNKEVTTKSNIKIIADKHISDIKPDDYDGLYIPGGTKGAIALRDDNRVIDIIKEAFDVKLYYIMKIHHLQHGVRSVYGVFYRTVRAKAIAIVTELCFTYRL